MYAHEYVCVYMHVDIVDRMRTTGPVLDQGGCGSCYTFVASQVFADRSNKALGTSLVMSPQSMLSCAHNYNFTPPDGTWCSTQHAWCTMADGCSGGNALAMFSWIRQNHQATCTAGSDGPCDAGCAPYASGWVSSARGETCSTESGPVDSVFGGLSQTAACEMPLCSKYDSCAKHTFDDEPGCLY